jgi:hypothetical protein
MKIESADIRWMEREVDIEEETGKAYLYRGCDRLGFWEGRSGIYVILAWCMGSLSLAQSFQKAHGISRERALIYYTIFK